MKFKDIKNIQAILVFIIAYMAILMAVTCVTSLDAYWHIKVGDWITHNLSAPTQGIFSYTCSSCPWTSHEWLASMLIYVVFDQAGWPGLVLMTIVSVTLSILILLDFLLKRLSAEKSAIFILMAFFLLIPHIMPRPHILALPLLVFWTSKLIDSAESFQPPPFYLLLVMFFWANLHGSFIIGLVFAVFFGLESFFSCQEPEIKKRLPFQWLVFTVLSTLCAVLTPHGFNSLLLPIQLNSLSYALDHVSEWASPDFHSFQPLEIWLLLFLAVTLTQGLKLPLFRIIFLLGLLHLSLKHIRYSSDLLSVLGPMILATPFAGQWNSVSNLSIQNLYPKNFKHWLALSVFIGVIVVFLFEFRTIESRESLKIGQVLTTLQKEQNTLGNVLNSYSLGGYLIHYGYQTFIDTRAEVYGDQFIKYFSDIIFLRNGTALLENALDEHHITWIFIETLAPANLFFDSSPDWETLYTDNEFSIYLHNTITIKDSTRRNILSIENSWKKD